MKKIILFICILNLVSGCITKPKNASESGAEDTPPPKLLAPNVKKIWIAPVVKDDGSEWEAGHYLFRIERRAQWSRQ